jgi:hypothetical protein
MKHDQATKDVAMIAANAIDKILQLIGKKPEAYLCEFYADPGHKFLSFEPVVHGTNVPLYAWEEKK